MRPRTTAPLLVLLAACGPRGSDDDAIRAHDTDGDPLLDDSSAEDSVEDSAEDSAIPDPSPCPPEMATLRDSDGAVVLCLDRYEVRLVDEVRDDQGHPLPGPTASLPGVMPTEGLSFDDARTSCALTPAVGPDGEDLGFKHLATLEEWVDGADGVAGPGGLRYPYGDDWRPGACAVPGEDGRPVVDGAQPTGSLPACGNPLGVFDAVGNLWEWADPEVTLDHAALLREGAALGLVVDADGYLRLERDTLDQLSVEVIGFPARNLRRAEDGLLYHDAAPETWPWGDEGAQGIAWPVQEPVPRSVGGVRLEPEQPLDQTRRALVRLLPEEDGEAVPDKRGCAWYTGRGPDCDHATSMWGHTHDFTGTIGFRCALRP